MDFLQHIRACNNYSGTHFLPFRIDGLVVGRLRHQFADLLRNWSSVFDVSPDGVELASHLRGFEERSAKIAEVLPELVKQGAMTHLHGEQYVATAAGREQGLALIDRAAAPYFGIRAFGQHINGFVREGGALKMWVARRAMDRRNYPGRLDNIAAGGLPYDISLHENLLKECREEAGIPAELAARARSVGTVTYNAETEKGFKPDTLYCYDLELPPEFVPQSLDGEVADFYLWPIEKVMEVVGQAEEFKLNCNLVVIDFLVRHGFLGPEREDYQALVTGLHPPAMPADPD
jgi:8-oxo-dGTP pyrophosphatase MutT (NUDIX family)